MSNEGVGSASWFGASLILLCSAMAIAEENRAIPNAPSSQIRASTSLQISVAPDSFVTERRGSEHARVIDRQFLILSAISTAAIFADSYTTTWIGNNYRARGPGPCTVEGGEPQLYGLHPRVARSYGVGALMSGGAIAISFASRKYLPSRVRWMWPGPFLYETGISVHGFGTNLARC
jgi:hypothetical protein